MVSGTEYLLGFVIKPESFADTSCGTEDSARANIKAMPFRIVIDPSRSSWGSRYAPFEAVGRAPALPLANPSTPSSAQQPLPPRARDPPHFNDRWWVLGPLPLGPPNT